VISALKAPYELSGHKLRIGASIGIANFPEHATDAETLLKYADIAMYQAKNSGCNNYKSFRPDMASSGDPTRGGSMERFVHTAADHSFRGVKETVVSKRRVRQTE